MSTKKRNSYVRVLLYMLAGAVVGGILGGVCSIIFNGRERNIEEGLSAVMLSLQQMILPMLCVIAVLAVLAGEISMNRLKRVLEKVLATEDEECDYWEYQEEKLGAIGLNICNFVQVLCILVLSLGYSAKYIESSVDKGSHFLVACVVFILCLAYEGIWQIRYVKQIQRAHPEKKGDPSSRKFRKEWLASCDEAEKELIYQSAYQTYVTLNRIIPILLLVTMLLHLFFDTGLLAIAVVGVIWMSTSLIYTHACVTKKGEKAAKLR